jgi:hypothetical protein
MCPAGSRGTRLAACVFAPLAAHIHTTTYFGRIAAATCWYTPTCFARFLP